MFFCWPKAKSTLLFLTDNEIKKCLVLCKTKSLKKFFLSLIFLLLVNCMFGQTPRAGDPAYIAIPTVPPFKLMLAPDSSLFTKDDLRKKWSTIIFMFSPDCEHCIRATEDLLAHYKLFKKTQIIMATSLSYDHIQKFYTDHRIADFPNIKMGIDNTYFLGSFYKIRRYPTIFLYNKKGRYKAIFNGDIEFTKIANQL